MDRQKQDALERLVNVEPVELCTEAKLEHCRATRDLRMCGRVVQHLLASCGHACLCADCHKQSDICPICRAPITGSEASPHLRLYDELVEAGLISHAMDEEMREREKEGQFVALHVQRLCSMFDVALENNLVSLICHYVSEVCMDEGAVSSDAMMSILLDGDVVKEWCKRTAGDIVRSLRDIYNLGFKQLQSKADAMYKYLRKLEGVQYVLDALDVPVIDPPSASLLEVRNLSEAVRKASQHLEVMAWCTRQSFLENLPSCFANIGQWRNAIKERKIAAQERAWDNDRTRSGSSIIRLGATLFIEDALANLGISKEEEDAGKDILELRRLMKDFVPSSPLNRSGRGAAYPMISGSSIVYPPPNVRGAVDLLFLEGSSELILAKKAIFLYYLFDRHWSLADTSWRSVVDDYVCTFSMSRPFMLESLSFYLLDDKSDQALEEACRLLPEIMSPTVHPKVSHVLLERGMPEVALSVLRCSGRDGHFGAMSDTNLSVSASISEAVTAVRVRLQCGLLAEAYLYQRAHWLKLKSEDDRKRHLFTSKIDLESLAEQRSWYSELEILVEEICWFSIRHNCLKDMTELPWLSDEESVLKQSLFDHVVQDPSSTTGNFLVAFYIQRCRYVEAYLVHRRLCDLENQFKKVSNDKEKKSRILQASAYRTRITEACVDLLPLIQQQQLLSGKISDARLENRGLLPLSTQRVDFEQPASAAIKRPQFSNDIMSSPLFESPVPKKLLFTPQSQQDGGSSTSNWSKLYTPPIANGKRMHT